MAKIFVIDRIDGTRVPFLRGILTRSLHDAGISFEEAYALATTIRQELGDSEEVTTDEIQQRVIRHLRKSYKPEVLEAYTTPVRSPATILVTDTQGETTPFSRAKHLQYLESCGLSNEDASQATTRVYDLLIEKGVDHISSGELGALTYKCLKDDYGEDAAHRYLVWVDYTRSGRPLILLLGGTTGCGKSTIATEVAHRLGIVRTQSTDMLREVMRMMIPNRLLPVLHVSSFDAWKVLPMRGDTTPENLVAEGYVNQANLLSVPCEAVIQRALRERVSLILEGVHVYPDLLEHIDTSGDAIIIPIILAVLKRKALQERIAGRHSHAPQRGAERHISSFDAIWKLQSFLLSEADRTQVPIVANDDKEKAANLVLGTIIDALSEGFDSTPEEVFGEAVDDSNKSTGKTEK
ncbi:MAG TPA: hypothetical protein EYH03_05425 [Chromatiales bacterium]|nr:hypothetical protein [Chromatiales bacterium]